MAASVMPMPADPVLVVLLGAPGAGKTSWARARYAATQILSLDQLRGVVADDPNDQDATADAVAVMHQVLTARLGRGLTTVIDATNAHRAHRAPLTAAAAAAGVPAVAVVLDTPVRLCVARQTGRPGPTPGARWGRRVDAATVRAIHRQITADLPGLVTEFAAVHVINPSEAM